MAVGPVGGAGGAQAPKAPAKKQEDIDPRDTYGTEYEVIVIKNRETGNTEVRVVRVPKLDI